MKDWHKALVIMITPLFLVGGVFFIYFRAKEPRIEIRNLTGAPLSQIVIELSESGYNPKVNRQTLSDIPSGGAATFYFPAGDFHVNLKYQQGATPQALECGLIGEKWEMYLATIEADSMNTKCNKFAILERPN